MITLNAEYLDGTGVLVYEKPVDVALCYDWLDIDDLLFIKCVRWGFEVDEYQEVNMYFSAITSLSDELTLDDAAFSGELQLWEQFYDYAETANFSKTDSTTFQPEEQPVFLDE